MSLARLKRRILTMDDVNKMKDATPALKKGSSQMFRTLRDKGELSERNVVIRGLKFHFLCCRNHLVHRVSLPAVDSDE